MKRKKNQTNKNPPEDRRGALSKDTRQATRHAKTLPVVTLAPERTVGLWVGPIGGGRRRRRCRCRLNPRRCGVRRSVTRS